MAVRLFASPARLTLALCLLISASGWAQTSTEIPDKSAGLYLASIELHTAAELTEAMQRAEHLHLEAKASGRDLEPIAFVLHGPEVLNLLTPSYENNRSLVDLAARLSAFQYIDLKVCRRWLGGRGIDTGNLPPFIGTVPYGGEEIERLMSEGYVYF